MEKRPDASKISVTDGRLVEFAKKIWKWTGEEADLWEEAKDEYCELVYELFQEPDLDGYRLARVCESEYSMDPDASLVDILEETYNVRRNIVKDLVKDWVQRNNLTISDSLMDKLITWKMPYQQPKNGWVVDFHKDTYEITVNTKNPRDLTKTFQGGYIAKVEDITVPGTDA